MAFLSSHPSSFSLCPSILDTYPAFLSKYTLIAATSKRPARLGAAEK